MTVDRERAAIASHETVLNPGKLGPVDGSGKKLRRRQLLVGSAAGVVVALGYVSYGVFFGDPKSIVLAVLRRRLGYLSIEGGVFDEFAADYSEWKDRKSLLRKLSVVALPLRLYSPYDHLTPMSALRRLEDSIVSQFLLSTDFFRSGDSPPESVQYFGFYDPTVMPCANPFWRPVDRPV